MKQIANNAIVLEPGQMASAEYGLHGRQPKIAMKKECKQKHTDDIYFLIWIFFSDLEKLNSAWQL